MKRLFIIVFGVILLGGCKKDPSVVPINNINYDYCKIYSSISADTNYIPHKLHTGWSYCNEGYAGWSGGIILDTIITGKIYFNRLMQSQSSHNPYSNLDKFIVDTIGNYHYIYESYGVIDTVLFIKQNALNGDTIHNNLQTKIKVVVINKNESYKDVEGCYHIEEIHDGYRISHYYRKGIGELSYCGMILNSARIIQ